MEILISIVIPTYNRSIDLRRAIHSVIGQTYKNWELIIVDNHSNDDTDEMVSSFNNQRIKLFKIYNNGVIAKSRNYGITKSKGEYVAFLDSDDWWMERKLEFSIKLLNKGVDVIYHDLIIVSKTNQKLFFRKTPSQELLSPVHNDLLKKGCVLTTSSIVVRKNVLTDMGGLPEDPEMGTWCDYFGWLHIAKQTDKFVRLPGTFGYYWSGGGNYTTPERTIKAISYFEQVYSRELKQLDSHALRWLNYTKGRVYFRLKFYKKSMKYLNHIKFDLDSILMSTKVIMLIIIIKLKIK